MRPRYEGIDQRVVEHAATRAEVREISVGDYVLNGGEVAALVITEAVVRLLPGFMGNAGSLVEESHEAGLLEPPVYTKPPSWRGLDTPPVLLSGDHAAIAAWRRDQAVARTAARRPDLVHASTVIGAAGEWDVVPAVHADAAEIYTLQLACWVTEAIVNDDLTVPPLHEGLDDVRESITTWDTYVVRRAGRLVGSVRGRLEAGPEGSDTGTTWEIGRLMVAPDLRGQGLGRVLLDHAQAVARPGRDVVRAVHRHGQRGQPAALQAAGFRVREVLDGPSGPVVLTKPVRRASS